MKTVMVGERKFHLPFVDLVPIDPDHDQILGESIEEVGAVLVPVICWKEKKASTTDTVIDGAHRILHAARLSLQKVPIIYLSCASVEEAKDECERLNQDRRQMSPNELTPARAARIERVAERRRAGESIRKIATEEGVSKSQVERDLEDAAVPGGGTVEPESGTVQGLDGRTRTATPKKKDKEEKEEILCRSCKLGSPRPGCTYCAKARAEAKEAAKEQASSNATANGKDEPSSEPTDDFKNILPKRCRDAFCDPWIQNTYDFLCVMSEKIRKERIGDGIRKRGKHFPFLDAKEIADGATFIIQYLDGLIDHFKANRPAGVCPDCAGKGCADCKMSGLVPRQQYLDATKGDKQ